MNKTTRMFVAAFSLMLAGSLVLFAMGTLVGESAQKSLIASKVDQITSLRQRAERADAVAALADTRADALSHDALIGIQTIKCGEYRLLEVTATFARLVYESDTATTAQRLSIAPFITTPPRPKGCTRVPPTPNPGAHP